MPGCAAGSTTPGILRPTSDEPVDPGGWRTVGKALPVLRNIQIAALFGDSHTTSSSEGSGKPASVSGLPRGGAGRANTRGSIRSPGDGDPHSLQNCGRAVSSPGAQPRPGYLSTPSGHRSLRPGTPREVSGTPLTSHMPLFLRTPSHLSFTLKTFCRKSQARLRKIYP